MSPWVFQKMMCREISRQPKKIFNPIEHVKESTWGDAILADLYLREGDTLAAKTVFKQYMKFSMGKGRGLSTVPYCLERLGDVNRWGTPNLMSEWTIIFLVHSLKFKERLGIFKALQFLGDMFLNQDDEHTAISLFTVALEGFTYMDVHRSRAECMLRLGDISKKHGDLIKAVELWDAARPLFERSSQGKQIEPLNERLAAVGQDVLEQHKANLARLAELNVPPGSVEDTDDPEDVDSDELDLENQMVSV
ncbi:hypothetical protein B0H13DRAFT_1862849 [Mycena leptocephala]|nr:hypothetical protein B0H13DRAFT_1862849 [Mycena leptocephala]